MIYSDMTIIALATGVIIPLLVGLLTKLNASSAVKAVLNFGLSALAGGLATVSETDFQWKPFLVNFALTWVVSIATYYGLWSPSGVSAKVNDIAPEVGIG
jgi:hypothetical protein